MTRRTIVIGDVHGCHDELMELVIKAGLRLEQDRVIMLGDLMDKGPEPVAALRWVRDMGFEAVMSNHEERHVRWWRREKARREQGKANNMKPWHDDKDRIHNEQLTADDIEWMASRPPWLEIVPGWFAVHGGFQPNIPVEKQDPTKVLRLRYINDKGDHVPIDYDVEGPKQPPGTHHWTELWTGPESVVYGHEAFSLSQPKVDRKSFSGFVGEDVHFVNTWGIDTGCVHGGHLTALVFEPSGRLDVVQVKALQVYCQPPHPIPE